MDSLKRPKDAHSGDDLPPRLELCLSEATTVPASPELTNTSSSVWANPVVTTQRSLPEIRREESSTSASVDEESLFLPHLVDFMGRAETEGFPVENTDGVVDSSSPREHYVNTSGSIRTARYELKVLKKCRRDCKFRSFPKSFFSHGVLLKADKRTKRFLGTRKLERNLSRRWVRKVLSWLHFRASIMSSSFQRRSWPPKILLNCNDTTRISADSPLSIPLESTSIGERWGYDHEDEANGMCMQCNNCQHDVPPTPEEVCKQLEFEVEFQSDADRYMTRGTAEGSNCRFCGNVTTTRPSPDDAFRVALKAAAVAAGWKQSSSVVAVSVSSAVANSSTVCNAMQELLILLDHFDKLLRYNSDDNAELPQFEVPEDCGGGEDHSDDFLSFLRMIGTHCDWRAVATVPELTTSKVPQTVTGSAPCDNAFDDGESSPFLFSKCELLLADRSADGAGSSLRADAPVFVPVAATTATSFHPTRAASSPPSQSDGNKHIRTGGAAAPRSVPSSAATSSMTAPTNSHSTLPSVLAQHSALTQLFANWQAFSKASIHSAAFHNNNNNNNNNNHSGIGNSGKPVDASTRNMFLDPLLTSKLLMNPVEVAKNAYLSFSLLSFLYASKCLASVGYRPPISPPPCYAAPSIPPQQTNSALNYYHFHCLQHYPRSQQQPRLFCPPPPPPFDLTAPQVVPSRPPRCSPSAGTSKREMGTTLNSLAAAFGNSFGTSDESTLLSHNSRQQLPHSAVSLRFMPMRSERSTRDSAVAVGVPVQSPFVSHSQPPSRASMSLQRKDMSLHQEAAPEPTSTQQNVLPSVALSNDRPRECDERR